jgi:hypothetical protein
MITPPPEKVSSKIKTHDFNHTDDIGAESDDEDDDVDERYINKKTSGTMKGQWQTKPLNQKNASLRQRNTNPGVDAARNSVHYNTQQASVYSKKDKMYERLYHKMMNQKASPKRWSPVRKDLDYEVSYNRDLSKIQDKADRDYQR